MAEEGASKSKEEIEKERDRAGVEMVLDAEEGNFGESDERIAVRRAEQAAKEAQQKSEDVATNEEVKPEESSEDQREAVAAKEADRVRSALKKPQENFAQAVNFHTEKLSEFEKDFRHMYTVRAELRTFEAERAALGLAAWVPFSDSWTNHQLLGQMIVKRTSGVARLLAPLTQQLMDLEASAKKAKKVFRPADYMLELLQKVNPTFTMSPTLKEILVSGSKADKIKALLEAE